MVIGWNPHRNGLLSEGAFEPVGPFVGFLVTATKIWGITCSIASGVRLSVCTSDLIGAFSFINRLKVGTCSIREGPGYRIEMSPFGGISDSGNAVNECVLEAMKFLTNVKSYSLPWPA